MSTIGLGDLVPGNSINGTAKKSEYKIIGVFVYLLIGLSLEVMAFNLMQETIVAKFRELATRVGIIDDEEENENDTASTENLHFIVSNLKN